MTGGMYAQDLSAALPQVAGSTWALTGQMSEARTGAAGTVLPDGSLLLTGGTDASGNVLASAEIYGADGSFQPAPPMQTARTGHSATRLLNGCVLVAGGTTGDGGIVNSAEIYDPVAKTWTLLPAMVDARSGHTATLLPSGDVLLAGGQNSSGALASLEIFRAATEIFSPGGTMSSPRTALAATALKDGRVLIAGGADANGATLGTTDIYDSKTSLVTAGPALNTPRSAATATTLLDGTVLIAGGSYPEGAAGNGQVAELATAELFDPTAGTITTLAVTLAHARSGHLAFLLPGNNQVLIAGGAAGGAALPYAELYTPWTQTFSPTASMHAARLQAAGGAVWPLTTGLLLVGGGSNLSTAELYGFPIIKTDQSDYAPGTPVNISGAGWQPGETVSLYLREVPAVDATPLLTTTADQNGRISNSAYAPGNHDLGIDFYLTAVGASSQMQAQTTFADGLAPYISVSCAPDPLPVNNATVCTVSVMSHGTCTPADGTTMAWTSASGNFTANACALSGLSCAVSFTPTQTPASVTASYPVTPGCASIDDTEPLNVAGTNPVPSTNGISPGSMNVGTPGFTLTVNGSNFGTGSVVYFNGNARATNYLGPTQLTALILTGDVATAAAFNVTVVNPAPGGGASNAQVFTVTKISQTITCLPAKIPYSLNPLQPCSASSGLPVIYSAVSGVVTQTPDGSGVVPTALGKATLTATQSGNADYLPASPVTWPVTVTPGKGTISCSYTLTSTTSPAAGPGLPAYATYGDPPIGFVCTSTSPAPLTYTVSSEAVLADKLLTINTVGTVTLGVSQGPRGNFLASSPVVYAMKVNRAPAIISCTYALESLTPPVTGPGLPATATYGDPPIGFACTSTSQVKLVYTISGPAKLANGTLTITGAGTIKIRVAEGASNLFAAAAPLTYSLTVSQAPLVITAPGGTWVYGYPAPDIRDECTVGAPGAELVNGDVSSPVPVASYPTVRNSPLGSYPVTCKVNTTVRPWKNYSITYVAGTLDYVINPNAVGQSKYSQDWVAPAGGVSNAEFFTLTNHTGAASVTFTINPPSSAFFAVSPAVCQAGRDQSCAFSLVFQPQAPNTTYTETLTIQVTDAAGDSIPSRTLRLGGQSW
jgi:hypothetical protein